MSSHALRVAVLGCGSIGRRHVRNLRAIGDVQIACFDPVVESAKNLAETVESESFDQIEGIWAWRPQAVVVAAPTEEHVPLALEALAHDCDLFVEKPLSHSLAGVEELCAEAARRERVTLVGCNMRFHPGPAAVKRLQDAGEIGAVQSSRIQTGSYLPRWRPDSDYRESYSASREAGGAVLDCIHEIDLALWYHGPASLLAAVVRPATGIGLATDGLAELLLEHESGVLSSLHLNFVQRDYRRCCQVIGERGTIYWDFAEGVVRVHGEDGAERLREGQPAEWDVNDMYLDETRHFLDCVRSRAVTVNPLTGGVAALRIAAAARAARSVFA
jgi:predicted dehydrogenase